MSWRGPRLPHMMHVSGCDAEMGTWDSWGMACSLHLPVVTSSYFFPACSPGRFGGKRRGKQQQRLGRCTNAGAHPGAAASG